MTGKEYLVVLALAVSTPLLIAALVPAIDRRHWRTLTKAQQKRERWLIAIGGTLIEAGSLALIALLDWYWW